MCILGPTSTGLPSLPAFGQTGFLLALMELPMKCARSDVPRMWVAGLYRKFTNERKAMMLERREELKKAPPTFRNANGHVCGTRALHETQHFGFKTIWWRCLFWLLLGSLTFERASST